MAVTASGLFYPTFEDMLTNDGCTGLAVLNPKIPREVQFDEHKLLVVYSDDLAPFEEILRDCSLPCDESVKFITEAEHVHSSSDRFRGEFEDLKMKLGMDGAVAREDFESLY